ncbi:hypothetical protein MMMDOFMJ_3793 [Methylobacterium gnaphalii]|nr:hypothetical protein MMMDOFMJ_3793 [Methylobacterium gnaphalii]
MSCEPIVQMASWVRAGIVQRKINSIVPRANSPGLP